MKRGPLSGALIAAAMLGALASIPSTFTWLPKPRSKRREKDERALAKAEAKRQMRAAKRLRGVK